EHHLTLTTVSAHHHRPRSLHHRVQRHLPLPRHLFQPPAHLLADPNILLLILSFLAFSDPLYSQLRRSFDPSQLLSPELLRRSEILLTQPNDIVSVGAYPLYFHLAPLAVGVIELEDLADDQLPAPPVKQYVMVSPNEVVGVFSYPHQSHLHQRPFRQFKPLLAFLPQ